MLAENKNQRLFFAIELDNSFRVAIVELIQILQKNSGGIQINWTPVEKLHITTHFLGNVSQDTLEQFLPKVENTVSQLAPLILTVGSLIALPKRHPRLIALTISLNKELAELFSLVKKQVEDSGLTLEDRPFLPHITLGRVKGAKPILAEHTELDSKFCSIQQSAFFLTLFSSKILSKGSKYEVVKRIPLAGLSP